MKTITVIIMMHLLGAGAYAQGSKLAELKIRTSAQCEDCKERIEETLAFEKGVKKSELDVETKIVSVSYRKDKTSPEKIRLAISRTGYDADDVAADPKAYSKLPACCQKPEDPEEDSQ